MYISIYIYISRTVIIYHKLDEESIRGSSAVVSRYRLEAEDGYQSDSKQVSEYRLPPEQTMAAVLELSLGGCRDADDDNYLW